jgi:hypothetical protein
MKLLILIYITLDILGFTWEFIASDFNRLGVKYDHCLLKLLESCKPILDTLSNTNKDCVLYTWQSMYRKKVIEQDLDCMQHLRSLYPDWISNLESDSIQFVEYYAMTQEMKQLKLLSKVRCHNSAVY